MRDADFAWLVEHSPELFKNYPGKWIAVHDGKIVGIGETAPEAAEKARTETGGDQFILEALDVDADVIYGTA